MKTQLQAIKQTFWVCLVLMMSVNFNTKAQNKNLKNEVLVYIMADSLEMPFKEKSEISFTEAKIASKLLKSTLEKIKPLSIGKAFKDWNETDTLKINKNGEKIKTPNFGRIFSLMFNNEEDAINAIKDLEKNPAVLFAEKNSEPKLYNDPQFINGNQWHLFNDGRNNGVLRADIHAPEAWSIFTGSTQTTPFGARMKGKEKA